MGCPFCQRIKNAEFNVTSEIGIASFEPLNPVTPGHRLFLPRKHIEHRDGKRIGRTFKAAHDYAMRHDGLDFNLITSSGVNATQSIDHIHVHLVPRREGDGLHLPWTDQRCGHTLSGMGMPSFCRAPVGHTGKHDYLITRSD